MVRQTKDEPREEPGFPAKRMKYSSQHKANLCWPSIPYQVWLVTLQQQPKTFSIIRCKRSKCALYQWRFSKLSSQKALLSTTTNFFNVWILPTFAVINTHPNTAFLTTGSAKFLKSQGHKSCSGRGSMGEGMMAITLFLSHLACSCHELSKIAMHILSLSWMWFPFFCILYILYVYWGKRKEGEGWETKLFPTIKIYSMFAIKEDFGLSLREGLYFHKHLLLQMPGRKGEYFYLQAALQQMVRSWQDSQGRDVPHFSTYPVFILESLTVALYKSQLRKMAIFSHGHN